MLMARDYFIQNWSLILISLAFLVSLRTTAFLDKTFSNRMCLLIASVLLLSVVVFFEFYLSEHGIVWKGRPYLTAVRYSAMPFVDALILYTLVKKLRKTLFIPACILAVLCFLSIWNGWVFRFEEDGTFVRGPLGLLPFIVPGTYGSVLVYTLYKRSNKQSIELIPIAYFAFALGSGVFLPFIFGPVYSHIFCTTIAIGLFTYYLFSVLNLTKKDSLTDLLNRQACYGDMEIDPSGITALVSIDMNGLKHINDTHGHAAGDEALVSLALCFVQAAKSRQSVYRIGGDEFLIICRHGTEEEVLQLIDRIKKNVAETPYSCAIGYSFSENHQKSISEMLRESDEGMYAAKAEYYRTAGIDRRRN